MFLSGKPWSPLPRHNSFSGNGYVEVELNGFFSVRKKFRMEMKKVDERMEERQ